MNNKAQVFLVAAIIFIFAISSVIIKYNQAFEFAALEDYDEITENYQNEFPKVANKAIYENLEVSEELKRFNEKFLKNAREKDPNYGALYAYKDSEGKLHIVNTLTKKVVNIKFESADVGKRVKDIQLIGDNVETPKGNIELEGIGSIGVSTKLDKRFGARFSNERDIDLEGIKQIKLEILTVGGGKRDIIINTKDFTLLNYISSEQKLTDQFGEEFREGGDVSVVEATLTTS